jgi:Na+-translocating ferredoxin:NAD+ oxidoreductase RnfG subunit
MAKLQEDFEKKFKNFDELFVAGNIKVPEIIYVANKAEDGYEGDILGEFY